MIKRIFAVILIFNLTACAELQQVVNQLPQSGGVLTNADIASGLRQVLDFGINKPKRFIPFMVSSPFTFT